MKFQVRDDEVVSQAVVRGVAAFENIQPEELSPLYEVVDPDALNALTAWKDGRGRFEGSVVFEFNRSHVLVDAHSPLTVTITDAGTVPDR